MSALIVPAQAAGFYSMAGRIAPAGDWLLSIPAAMLNIGGNGKGYLLKEQAEFNFLDPENNDSGFTSMALGENAYLYAVPDSGGYAKVIASKNATMPAGYTALNSRKIGGFHVGRVRPMAQKYNKAFTCPVKMIPNSVWCLNHRPKCDPTGLAEFAPGKWASIYRLSIASGSGLEARLQSAYNKTPVTGSEGYSYTDLHILLQRNGMRSPTYFEFCTAAHGAPQGATGQSARINTGMQTGYGFDCVSTANIDQTHGNIYSVGSEMYDRALTGSVIEWKDGLSTGIEAGTDFGMWHGYDMRQSLYGAYWGTPDPAGPRAVFLSHAPWDVSSAVGLLGVCDSENSVNLNSGAA